MYFITAIISKENLVSHVPFYHKLRSHTFGYYETFEEAHEAVTDNVGSLHECIYDYIVIENIGKGIHTVVDDEHWYYWCENLNCWMSCAKPVEFQGIINWALG